MEDKTKEKPEYKCYIGGRFTEEEAQRIDDFMDDTGITSKNDFVRKAIFSVLSEVFDSPVISFTDEEISVIEEAAKKESFPDKKTFILECVKEHLNPPKTEPVQPPVSEEREYVPSSIKLDILYEKLVLKMTELFKEKEIENQERQNEIQEMISGLSVKLSSFDMSKIDVKSLEKIGDILTDVKTTRNRQVRFMGATEMWFYQVFRILRAMEIGFNPYFKDFSDEKLKTAILRAEGDVETAFKRLFTRSHDNLDFDLWRDKLNENVGGELDLGFDIKAYREEAFKKHPEWEGEIPSHLLNNFFYRDAGNKDRADRTDKV